MYRFSDEEKEWKERGTGDLKLLKHKVNGKIRLLMRRDKTLKICANHLCASRRLERLRRQTSFLDNFCVVTSAMELKPHVGSDKAFVYHVAADFADEVAKPELLAVRFANTESPFPIVIFLSECVFMSFFRCAKV